MKKETKKSNIIHGWPLSEILQISRSILTKTRKMRFTLRKQILGISHASNFISVVLSKVYNVAHNRGAPGQSAFLFMSKHTLFEVTE